MPGLYGSATYASHVARAFIVRGIGVHASLTRGSRPPIRSRRSRLGGGAGHRNRGQVPLIWLYLRLSPDPSVRSIHFLGPFPTSPPHGTPSEVSCESYLHFRHDLHNRIGIAVHWAVASHCRPRAPMHPSSQQCTLRAQRHILPANRCSLLGGGTERAVLSLLAT